MNIQVAFRRTS